MKKIIGLDLDDVILDFNTGFLKFYNDKFGTAHKKSDINKYDYNEIFGISIEQAMDLFDEFTFSPYHIETAPLFGALEALNNLNEHEIYLISARPEHKRQAILDWLQKHLASVKFKDIHLIGTRRNEGDVNKSKSEVAKELGVSIFVEDALHNAIPIAESGIPVLLFDQPWNQMNNLPPGVTRVFTWEQIVIHLNK